jgi:hypothetical protein
MIAWVDEQCRAWGAHKRWLMFGQHGWPERSLLGKLVEEGPGAGSGSFVARVPIKDCPPSYTAITLALKRMAYTHELEKPWLVINAHYLFAGQAKNKAPILQISVPQYWQQLQAGHAFISACDVPRETESYIQNVASL